MTVANLGQIIKARRERMKINQENLAACAGISTKLLSDIECGRANPTFETMDLVAAALGVELEERPVADLHQQRLARHDPDQLARAVLQLMEDHTMRIFDHGVARYVRER